MRGINSNINKEKFLELLWTFKSNLPETAVVMKQILKVKEVTSAAKAVKCIFQPWNRNPDVQSTKRAKEDTTEVLKSNSIKNNLMKKSQWLYVRIIYYIPLNKKWRREGWKCLCVSWRGIQEGWHNLSKTHQSCFWTSWQRNPSCNDWKACQLELSHFQTHLTLFVSHLFLLCHFLYFCLCHIQTSWTACHMQRASWAERRKI